MNVPPALGLPAYSCPHCHAFAQQEWSWIHRHRIAVSDAKIDLMTLAHQVRFAALPDREKGRLSSNVVPSVTQERLTTWFLGSCSACGTGTVWLGGRLLFPSNSPAPQPGADMPAAASQDYEEAAKVVGHSPRAAAALLRLCTEKLLGHLLQREGRIDSMIADFVALGVPMQVQQAMDVLRVTGNEAVHPGTMDAVDDLDTALALFGLVNLIVDDLITRPKHVSQMYGALPRGKREAIEARNARATQPPDTAPGGDGP
jgi:hypothetical protein